MTWFYVHDHQVVGPVEPAEFAALVARGDIGPATLVWRSGMATWTRYGEMAPPLLEAPAETAAPRDLLVRVGPIWSQARDWFRREPWKLMGLVTGSTLALTVISAISFALNVLLPVASTLVAALVVGPLQTGVLLMLVEWIRGGRLELATVWRCFGPRYGLLATGQMILQVIFTAVLAVTMVGLGPMFAVAWVLRADPEAVPPEIALPILLIGAAVGMAGITVYFYLAVAWLFAPLLILDRGLSFWPAMQLSRRVAYAHPFAYSWFLLVASTIALAGALFLGVGLAITLPWGALMLVLAYEQQFGPMARGNASAPPVLQADFPESPNK